MQAVTDADVKTSGTMHDVLCDISGQGHDPRTIGVFAHQDAWKLSDEHRKREGHQEHEAQRLTYAKLAGINIAVLANLKNKIVKDEIRPLLF